jgi:hypothetical protein
VHEKVTWCAERVLGTSGGGRWALALKQGGKGGPCYHLEA